MLLRAPAGQCGVEHRAGCCVVLTAHTVFLFVPVRPAVGVYAKAGNAAHGLTACRGGRGVRPDECRERRRRHTRFGECLGRSRRRVRHAARRIVACAVGLAHASLTAQQCKMQHGRPLGLVATPRHRYCGRAGPADSPEALYEFPQGKAWKASRNGPSVRPSGRAACEATGVELTETIAAIAAATAATSVCRARICASRCSAYGSQHACASASSAWSCACCEPADLSACTDSNGAQRPG